LRVSRNPRKEGKHNSAQIQRSFQLQRHSNGLQQDRYREKKETAYEFFHRRERVGANAWNFSGGILVVICGFPGKKGGEFGPEKGKKFPRAMKKKSCQPPI